MLFHLVSLFGLVACTPSKMQVIDAYLNQLMTRVDYSVNYALDVAFRETGVGSEWEINALKGEVIDQARSLFRPMAKSILVESLQPRLMKRQVDVETVDEDEEVTAQPSTQNDEAPEPAPENASEPAPENASEPADTGADNASNAQEPVSENVKEPAADPNVSSGSQNTDSAAPNGDKIPTMEKVNEGLDPKNSWNLNLSRKVLSWMASIKLKLTNAFGVVAKTLRLEGIKGWFIAKEVENAEAHGGDGAVSSNGGMFNKFKSTFTSTLANKNIMLLFGTALMGSLIYYAFVKIDGVEQELDE